MSSVPALSAAVLQDVLASVGSPAVESHTPEVPLQWEENRSSTSIAELASVLVAALVGGADLAGALPRGQQRPGASWLCLCEGVKPTHGIGLARLRRELLHLHARGTPRGSGSVASSRRGAPLVHWVARRTRFVWDSVGGIQFCDACVLSRGP